MPVTRRDVLWGLGGGLAGAALTPVPWKLLDDSAIWTQRRHALPIPPRGPVRLHHASCTLCAAGCPLRVRTVGGRPIAAVGEARHPLGGGACAIGLTVHQLAYHPLRLAGPAARVGGRLESVSRDAAVARVARAMTAAGASGRRVVVLDRRPGRVVSRAWRELVSALPSGTYATVAGEGETLVALQAALTRPALLGIDLERTRTVVSFGAPFLEGWGRPGRVLAARRGGLRVVQVDAWRSHSAALADEWVAVLPGGEGPLALSLAHVVARERGAAPDADVRRVLAAFSPREAAARVGLAPDRIEALGRSLVGTGPTVAIGGGDPGGGPLPEDAERAIGLLNVVMGSVGCEGGVVTRRPLPEAASGVNAGPAVGLAEVPEASVGVLFLDAADDGRALPWPVLERVLATDAVVVSLSPFDGSLARVADVVVPAPAPLEAWDEVLPTPDASVASYALSAPVLTAPAPATDTVAFVQSLAEALGVPVGRATHEARLRERVAAIHAAGRGRLVARAEHGFTEASASGTDSFWNVLVAGGCWIDDEGPRAALELRAPLPGRKALERWKAPVPARDGLSLVAFAVRGTAGTTPASPLLTKLYQESDLRPAQTRAALNPETAARLGLGDGQRVRIASRTAAVLAELRVDATLPPGRVALAAGPDASALHPGSRAAVRGASALAVASGDGTWRETRVRVEEAWS